MVIAERPRTIDRIESKNINLIEQELSIPVYNLRNLDDQEFIARELAEGAQMAMFGGVWGGFKGVRKESQGEDFFHRVKPGRPKEAKIAMMVPPKDSIGLIDWSKVHPELQGFENPDRFRQIWESHGAYLHIIGPVLSSRIPEVFETTPEDYASRYQNSDPVPFSTACFFWRDDPHLERLSDLIRTESKGETLVGVTSLNRHGEQPPYTFEEFVDHLKLGKADPRDIHLVVRDSIYENSKALGSHTQARLPFPHEKPSLKILRIGTLSPEGFEKATGMPVEVVPDAKDVRKSPGVNIDHHIEEMNFRIRNHWASQQPHFSTNS